MNHDEWINKSLGEFIDYISKHYDYAIGFYSINYSISLQEVIGLCIYDKKFLDKYYNKTIKSITGRDYEYSINI